MRQSLTSPLRENEFSESPLCLERVFLANRKTGDHPSVKSYDRHGGSPYPLIERWESNEIAELAKPYPAAKTAGNF